MTHKCECGDLENQLSADRDGAGKTDEEQTACRQPAAGAEANADLECETHRRFQFLPEPRH